MQFNKFSKNNNKKHIKNKNTPKKKLEKNPKVIKFCNFVYYLLV